MGNQNKPYSNFKTIVTSQKWFRWAEVVRADYFRMTCDIKYLDAENYAIDVPFVLPGMYAGAFMGGMPEVGGVAMIGYTHHTQDFGNPVILGFFPRALWFAHTFTESVNLRGPQDNELDQLLLLQRMKVWKLYPGEFLISSKQGSDVRVDNSIFLQNSAMNEIYLDPYSQVMSFLALNQTMSSKAGRLNFGLIHRNELLHSDEYRKNFESASQYLSDGRYFFRATNAPKHNSEPYGTQSLDDNGVLGFTEFRIDIREQGDASLDVTEESSGLNQSKIDKGSGSSEDGAVESPLVTFVLGTLVGNDSTNDKELYGKVLTPVTFSSDSATDIVGEDKLVDSKDGIEGERTQAGAFQVKLPNTLTSFNFTKEGVLEFSLDQSSASHQLGAGRSANIGMLGSLKMVLGRQASDGKSLLLDLLGGASINIGGDTDKGRSLDIALSNGLNFSINGSDADRNSIRGTVKNNVDLTYSGNRYTQVYGDDITIVHGKHEVQVLGKKVDNIINDKSNNYGGSLKENVTQTYQSNVGTGRSITIAGPDILSGSTTADSKEILIGNQELMMFLGNRTETQLAGTYEEEILLGEKKTTIGVGDFNVSIIAGLIDMSTDVGNITLSTLAGLMSLSATQITLKALTQIQANAPIVSIGSLVQGGVVNSGPAGHRDYLTGLLLLGSATVTCNTI